MGGCRCTYKNCNVKSDGKTHMFHYPVFEKVRCHQWLVNAQRLEFLNLKVSQLKNRVVCQHHFREENFMNYMKDKLTFDAIPTEDGPFCDPSKFVASQYIKDYPNAILLEDIENDFDFNDKKSNFSVKYGDFLTNSEFIVSTMRFNRSNINLKNDAVDKNLNSGFYTDISKTCPKPQNSTRPRLPTKSTNKSALQPMLVVPPYSDLSNELKMGKQVNIENQLIDLHTNLGPFNKNVTHNDYIPTSTNVDNNVNELNNENVVKKEPKIRILSENKIKCPITIKGTFEKISPSVTLSLPPKHINVIQVEKQPEIIHSGLMEDTTMKSSDKIKVLEIMNVDYEPQSKIYPSQSYIKNTCANTIVLQSPPKKSQVKNKLTPERSAIIEKKRKFNMRLKDIIESCFDKIDQPQVKIDDISDLPTTDNLNKNDIDLEAITGKGIELKEIEKIEPITENETTPNTHDTTIAYLEARMKKMESTLLNKIEQNSQQIMHFKRSTKNCCDSATKSKKASNKKCVSTQTNVSEQCYKKFLYQEISKYLSPSANNIIFEELFIDKYMCDDIKSPTKRKRRKCI